MSVLWCLLSFAQLYLIWSIFINVPYMVLKNIQSLTVLNFIYTFQITLVTCDIQMFYVLNNFYSLDFYIPEGGI